MNNTWDAFGPRFGFAYDLTGRGNTVIRGGFGTMFERIQGNDMYNAATNSPWGYSLNTGSTAVLLSNPHDQVQSGGAITVPIVTSSITGLNQHYKVPTSYQYSVGVEQSIGKNAVFSASYVGNQSRFQSYFQEINLPPQSALPALQAGTSATPFNGLVPYLGYGSIKQAFTGQNGHYNSLQTEVHGHVRHDLYMQGAYTLSRAIDPSTGNGGNGFDLDSDSNPYAGWKYDNGPSLFDRTHIFFVNFVYDIPLFKDASNHLVKTVAGGWELSGIVSAESGAPLNINVSGTNVTSVFSGDTANRPDLTGKISYPKKVGEWFDTSAFAEPAAGTWGDLGYDSVRAPGRNNWNLSLFKQFLISESRGSRVEFRAESFNTWNHTQFGGSGQGGPGSGQGIGTSFGANNFGQVINAWDPRVFQLGLKLIY